MPFRSGAELQARLLFSTSSATDRMPNYARGSENFEALSLMIDSLLRKEAITPMASQETGFFNLVFLRPKKCDASESRLEKRWRLILDVSFLNGFLVTKKFKMETVQKIRSSIVPGLVATSIDLTDAYHHIPIHPNFQNFLAFQVGDRKFKYRAMPFGLSSAPQVFTEVMTPLKVFARKNFGGYIFQYLDDWLLLDRSHSLVLDLTRKFIGLCIEQGMLVNLGKSHLSPTTSLIHLGTKWDFDAFTVAVPDDKVQVVTATAARLVRHGRALISTLESLMGLMVSCEKLVHHGRINYRSFQACVIWNLRFGRRPRYVSLPPPAIEDLKWWSNKGVIARPVACLQPKHDLVVSTDASNIGWGAATDDWSVYGRWTGEEVTLHINHKELLAVLKTLELKAPSLANSTVLFLIDNTTTVSYISKQGGTRSLKMTRTVKKIYSLASRHNVFLKSVHVKGTLNVLADMLSRPEVALKTEWSLSRDSFLWVCDQSPWGAPTVDLFANRWNKQLDRYFSPCHDELALATDALVASWPFEVLFAFPPTTIMSEVVTKIIQERPERLLLVAPNWPNASWNPVLRSIAKRWRPIPHVSLSQPMSKYRHPSPHILSLALWLITFNGSPTEVTPLRY